MEMNFQQGRLLLKVALATGAAAALVALSACSVEVDGNSADSSGASGKDLTVFATTGYIGDAVQNIAPDAKLTTMIGPGGDPHTYQATTKDIAAMQDADVVLWSGLGLEASMQDQLEGLGDKQLAVAETIPDDKLLPWTESEEEHDHEAEEEHADHDHATEAEGAADSATNAHAGHDHGDLEFDPHVWNSTDNWKLVIDAIVEKLSEADTAGAATYKENGEKYKAEIDETAEYVQQQIDSIPEDQRTLISGHDAFAYFGNQFGLEIKATDFVSSDAQLSASELVELAQFIADHKVRTVFQDNVSNPQAIQSLTEQAKADGWEVTVSDQTLYAGSLGASAPQDTYLGVMRYNAETIAKALS